MVPPPYLERSLATWCLYHVLSRLGAARLRRFIVIGSASTEGFGAASVVEDSEARRISGRKVRFIIRKREGDQSYVSPICL